MKTLVRTTILCLSLPFCAAYDALAFSVIGGFALTIDVVGWSWGSRVDWGKYRKAATESLTLAWYKAAKKVMSKGA